MSMFAPDIPQMHVINHLKGEPAENETRCGPSSCLMLYLLSVACSLPVFRYYFRNVLVESGRLARGNIKAIGELKSNDFDAVLFPGGFGAAKNL